MEKIPFKAAGCLTEPPISDPIPKHEPLSAPIAPSPPEEPPPLRYFRLNGFKVRPHRTLVVSEYIIPAEVLVLQIITAPSLLNNFTIAASEVAILSANPTNPIDDANPSILMLSFKETTTPWSGPMSFLCVSKYSS
ncbi:hypothetical protein OGAPHI_000552 [Ogataea philodendri]|uniref:Uncharacterized protein n=1 Tax=Ogataea philodendri TaxID=1378263 RepID=A0A9P8TA79_9ASCO|nr:uncharacterized protein OGAPHI_000552 [Ogataea philodendri]KAH3671329.1 hypothetical protein OGAPHI_000552 [Ogataea philodendri]